MKFTILVLLALSAYAEEVVAPTETAPTAQEPAPENTTGQPVESDPVIVDDETEAGQLDTIMGNSQVMGSIGLLLLFTLVCLSNAGGLSGGGVTIPIMLIFFDMDMKVAVPVSAFIAVCSTVLRFIINFNQLHPNNPERLTINYDVVVLTLPAVFLGSLIGVKIGLMIT